MFKSQNYFLNLTFSTLLKKIDFPPSKKEHIGPGSRVWTLTKTQNLVTWTCNIETKLKMSIFCSFFRIYAKHYQC